MTALMLYFSESAPKALSDDILSSAGREKHIVKGVGDL
jgi:hypothetical protein